MGWPRMHSGQTKQLAGCTRWFHDVLVVREDRMTLLRGVSFRSGRLGKYKHVGPPSAGLPLGVDRSPKLFQAAVMVA